MFPFFCFFCFVVSKIPLEVLLTLAVSGWWKRCLKLCSWLSTFKEAPRSGREQLVFGLSSAAPPSGHVMEEALPAPLTGESLSWPGMLRLVSASSGVPQVTGQGSASRSALSHFHLTRGSFTCTAGRTRWGAPGHSLSRPAEVTTKDTVQLILICKLRALQPLFRVIN